MVERIFGSSVHVCFEIDDLNYIPDYVFLVTNFPVTGVDNTSTYVGATSNFTFRHRLKFSTDCRVIKMASNYVSGIHGANRLPTDL